MHAKCWIPFDVPSRNTGKNEVQIVLGGDQLAARAHKLERVAKFLPMLDCLERVVGSAANQLTVIRYPIVTLTPRSFFLARGVGSGNLKPMRAIADWLPIPEQEKAPNAILAPDMEVRKGVEPAPGNQRCTGVQNGAPTFGPGLCHRVARS
jgi:hypothetical protein